jgi:hypothetical protein
MVIYCGIFTLECVSNSVNYSSIFIALVPWANVINNIIGINNGTYFFYGLNNEVNYHGNCKPVIINK